MHSTFLPRLGAPLRRPVRAILVVLLVAVAMAGCDEREERTISGEAFIATMADLRSEAARTPFENQTEEEIDAILERHSVTREQLRTFVEVHGENVPMMADIWGEVDRRVHADAGDEEDASHDTLPDPPADTLTDAPEP